MSYWHLKVKFSIIFVFSCVATWPKRNWVMKHGCKNILSGFKDLGQKLQLCLYQLNVKVAWTCFKKTNYQLVELEGSYWESEPWEKVRERADSAVVDTYSVAMLTCPMQSSDNAPDKNLSDSCFLIGFLWKTSPNKPPLNKQQSHPLTQE